MSNKTLHPKAKHALNAALAGLLILLSILFAAIKWIMITGTFTAFAFSILTIILSVAALKEISKEKNHYRGDNMAWIALILGILIFLMTIPFVIQFIGTLFI